MSKGVSIIICSYNGAQRLLATLQYISKLDCVGIDVELLVIDNNSSDNTSEIAKEFCAANLSIPWSVIIESNPGLTHARLCGIRNAKYDILLFCDDDNWLASDYIKNGVAHGLRHPQLAIWGAGISEGVFEVEPAKWADPYLRMLAIFNNGEDRIGAATADQAVVSGAGMFMTMEFAKRYAKEVAENPLRAKLDRTGNVALAGGDSDMHKIAYQLGYCTGYFMDLSFKHYMPKERLSAKYFLRLKRNMSLSTVVLQHINHEPMGKVNIAGVLFYIIKSLFVQPMESFMTIEGLIGRKQGMKYIKSWMHEN
jgi:glycosyltransferase involved in cell wall biosynthesis